MNNDDKAVKDRIRPRIQAQPESVQQVKKNLFSKRNTTMNEILWRGSKYVASTAKNVSSLVVYFLVWTATTIQVASGSIEGVSSLGFAPPSTEMGKKSSPAMTEDQVSLTGAFHYSIPLQFPAGIDDMKPQISIGYSSDAPLRGSVLGAGWQLSVPMITGDTSRPSVDKTGANQSTTHYISKFMGGGKLIRQSDSPIANEDVEVYFALHDNKNVRYERHLNPAEGKGLWRVLPGDGFIYEFGSPSFGEYYRAPLIRQTHEHSGMTIQYQWLPFEYSPTTESVTATEFRLIRAIYKKTQADTNPFAEVYFSYNTMKECGNPLFPVGARIDYHYGDEPQLYGSQALRAINVRARRPKSDANGGMVLEQMFSDVRKYEFTYDDETASCDFNFGAPLRRLNQVQETAYAPLTGVPTTLPPLQFTYGEFEPAKTRIFEKRDFDNLTLPRGEDVSYWYGQEPAVSRMLADIDGDGYEDLIVREVGTADTDNRAFVYENINGTGFSSTATSFTFPEWLPEEFSMEVPDHPIYQDKSLGLSGQIKFYADFTELENESRCGQPLNRIGSKESFGLVDVNHDGLLDAVTELEFDPRWVGGKQMGFPAPLSDNGGFSTFSVNDPGDSIDLCSPSAPPSRERWPVWRVRYNLGTSFSNTVVEVDAPSVLASINLRGSMSSSYGGGTRIHRRNFQGDLNGDGLGDILDRAKLDPGQHKAEFAYNSQGFFVPGPIDDPSKYGAPAGIRWMVVGSNDGLLYRVPIASFGWKFRDDLTILSGSIEENLGNGSYRYKTTLGAADINGDGLQDLVTRWGGSSDWKLEYYPNNGRRWLQEGIVMGSASDQNPVDYLGLSGSYVAEKAGVDRPIRGSSYNLLIQEDINSDGLVDMIRLGNPNNDIYVYANNGLNFSKEPGILSLSNDPDGSMTDKLLTALLGTTYMGEAPDGPRQWRKTGGYVDLTGDGLKDAVIWNRLENRYELYAAVEDQVLWATHPPYLLNYVTNGQGMQMFIDYASTGDSQVVTQGDFDGDWHSIRRPRWITKSIEVQPSTGVQMTTSFQYNYPVTTRDYYGKNEFRGFRERVTTKSSGMEIVDRYDYNLHYPGLFVEQLTYSEENPEYPHKIVEKSYIDYAPVHDEIDNGMISTPRNWYQVEQVTTTCPDGTGVHTDGEAHCKTNGDSITTKTDWVALNYHGDGISSSARTHTVPEKKTVIFDDGHGNERILVTTTQYQIRADADEYLVRKRTILTKDYSTNTRRIVSHTHNQWNNQLRELGLYSEFVYEGDTQAAVKTTRYEYDHRGLVIQIREPKEYAEGGYAGTRYEYDELGINVTKETNPLGHVVQTVTDIGTDVPLLTLGPNSTENAMGSEVLERTRLVVDGLGRTLEKYVSQDDEVQGYKEILVERNSYLDGLVFHNGVRGTKVKSETLIDDGAFTETTTLFDGLGRELHIELVSEETANAETHYHWDSAGFLAKIDVPDPSMEGQQVSYHFSYDSLGRQTQNVGPDGVILSITRYEGLTTISSEIGETNAPAAEKRLTYNANGQLVKVKEKLDDGSFAFTTYQYDGAGNVEVITDPEGVVTLMMHDTAGRRIAIAAGGQTWEYEYDHNDNVTALINPHPIGEVESYTTRMEYDLLDRMVRRIPAQADLSDAEKAEFSWGETVNVYDEPHPSMATGARNHVGRLGYSSSSVVTNLFQYNVQGQVVDRRQILNVEGLGEATGVELASLATYYANGQLRTNSVLDLTTGNPLVMDLLHEYDSRGMPARISTTVEIARLVRNHAGLVKQRRTTVDGNQVVANYTFDNLGRITFAGAIQAPSGIRPFNQWYSYFANGNVKKIQEKPADGEFRSMHFVWDTRHQVKEAFQGLGNPGYSATFEYNRAGRLTNTNVSLLTVEEDVLNQTRVHERNVSYVYNELDPQQVGQLLHHDDFSIYAEYNYDMAGNVIERIVDGNTWQLRYDGENRLRKVTNENENTVELYFYDGPNRILSVRYLDGTVNQVRRWFSGGELIYRNGIHEKNRFYAKLGQTVARIENGTEVEYVFQTPQGHEALSIKADGTVNSGKLYGPFGEVLYSELASDKSPEDYTREFNGKDYDHVSGLHYYGYRYYDPVALMWNRADPMYRFIPDAAYDESRRMNLYAFCLNNPVHFVDPDGRNPIQWAKMALDFILGSNSTGDAVGDSKAVNSYSTAAKDGLNGRSVREGASRNERGIHNLAKHKAQTEHLNAVRNGKGGTVGGEESRKRASNRIFRDNLERRRTSLKQQIQAKEKKREAIFDAENRLRDQSRDLIKKIKDGTAEPWEKKAVDDMEEQYEKLGKEDTRLSNEIYAAEREVERINVQLD